MTSIGLHKIFGLMLLNDLSLSELTKFSKLTKPTVLYHMDKLQKQGIVRFDEKKKIYSMKIDDDVKIPVLKNLFTKKTLDELAKDIENAQKESPKNSKLHDLVNDDEFLLKLNDLVEYLSLQNLVTEVRPELGSKDKEFWQITWEGCSVLKICHVCNKEFSREDDHVIGHVINEELNTPDGIELIKNDVAMIHTKCLPTLQTNFSDRSYLVLHYDYCMYCGLSLSEDELRAEIKYNKKLGKFGLQLLYPLLSKDEREALTSFRNSEEEKAEAHNSNCTNIVDCISQELENRVEPSLSYLEEVFGEIGERTKELFSEWKRMQEIQDEKLDKVMLPLFGDPISNVLSKIKAIPPRPFDPIDRQNDPFGKEVLGIEFNFARRDEKGNRYHDFCYQKLINSKRGIEVPIVQENKN